MLDPRVGKILRRRKWQPTPVVLPGQSYGGIQILQAHPGGLQSMGRKELDMTERLHFTSDHLEPSLASCLDLVICKKKVTVKNIAIGWDSLVRNS